MVELDHAIGILTQRLGPEMANARSAAERDQALKEAMSSTQFNHLMDQEGDEVHDKVQSALQNSQILDKVHISPEAQKLFEGGVAGEAPPAPEGTPEETE